MNRASKDMFLTGVVVVLVATALLVSSAPTRNRGGNPMKKLEKFGYMEEGSSRNSQSEKDISNVITIFQAFNGLNQTGRMDDQTADLLNTPRCKNKDPWHVVLKDGNVTNETATIIQRPSGFVLTGGKWDRTALTYKLINYTPDLYTNEIEDAILRSFKVWSDVTPLTFTRVDRSQPADIDMLFGAYYHGDAYPFDGPSGFLAHAYPPKEGALEGDIHFDESEYFTINSVAGINLFQVATHEIGHALGLDHSSDPYALMAPFYRGFIRSFLLPADDTAAIQYLYGVGGESEPGTSDNPKSCNKIFDAVTYFRGEIWAFKGDKVWRMPEIGYTISDQIDGDSMNDIFVGLPSDIDAAYENSNWDLIVFKGNTVYKFDGYYTTTYSLSEFITHNGIDLPQTVDAALSYVEYKKTYLFSGNYVWRLDEKTMTVDKDFPARIADVFRGVPDQLSGAFRHKKSVFFVKDLKYYRYSDHRRREPGVDQGYPRSFGVDFLGCNTLDQ